MKNFEDLFSIQNFALIFNSGRGRAVKASDQKSDSLWERRFESYRPRNYFSFFTLKICIGQDISKQDFSTQVKIYECLCKEGKMAIESTRKKVFFDAIQIIRDPRGVSGGLKNNVTISKMYERHIVGPPPLECHCP